MYCTNCGSEIPDEAMFCPFCAKPVGSSTSPHIQPPQPSQPSYQATPYTPSKPKKTTGGAAVAVLLVVVVGIILVFFGTRIMFGTPTTGISLLIIGVVMICCVSSTLCRTGKHRGGSWGGGGGCDCSGCDCGDCDCS